MKAPFVFERLGWATGERVGRFHHATMRKRNGRNFWEQYMAWGAPQAGIGFIIWLALMIGLAFGAVYGGEALGILKFNASDDQIKQAYHEVLHRDPDAGGMKAYKESGWSYDHIKEDLNKSAEKQTMDKAVR